MTAGEFDREQLERRQLAAQCVSLSGPMSDPAAHTRYLLQLCQRDLRERRVRERHGFLWDGFFLCSCCRRRTERIDQETRCCWCGERIGDSDFVRGVEAEVEAEANA